MRSGQLILRVKREGATAYGILQTLTYDDATPKTYAKARKELEARRAGWQDNYPAFANAQFDIEDKATGAAREDRPATAKGAKATQRDFDTEARNLERTADAARKRVKELAGKRGQAEWRAFVRELDKAHRDLLAQYPQFCIRPEGF